LRMAGLKPEALEALRKAFAADNRYRFVAQGSQALVQTKDAK
jgi:hypothetical protein